MKLTDVSYFRWKGDYGDQKEKYFPANYCEELNLTVANDENDETNEVSWP